MSKKGSKDKKGENSQAYFSADVAYSSWSKSRSEKFWSSPLPSSNSKTESAACILVENIGLNKITKS